MAPAALRTLQFARLKNLVERVYTNVPFYRKKLESAGISPADIKTLDDIAKLPFTSKDDLRET